MNERINEIARRIVKISDTYDVWDVFGSEEEAVDGITYEIVNDPLAVIEELVNMIEELQAEV